MNMPNIGWLEADWPAPTNIRAGTSLRRPGPSQGPYAAFNLALHVEDDADTVLANRQQLRQSLDLPGEPCWLEQVHSNVVVETSHADTVPTADASFSHRAGDVCVVMTADCLPVLLTNRAGSRVAAAHAGWRGLADGVLENTLQAGGFDPAETLVWLGPGIGADVYEIGEEVRQAFLDQPVHNASAFVEHGTDKYLMDMYALARQRLTAMGVTAIYGGEHCTYREADKFYSYRRDGLTGRMASLIWME